MRQSESARVTTAKEAKFRIQYPNSQPRSLKIIALDREAGQVVEQVSRLKWNRAVFFKSMTFASPKGLPPANGRKDMQAWLDCVAGQAKDLVAEIDSADSMVVIASSGTDADGAALIGEICQMRHKSMIGLVLRTAATTDQELSRTLLGLRPYTTMLVVASGAEYVEDMLTAMRA